LRHKRYPGAAADRRDGGQLRRRHPVALQQVEHGGHQVVDRFAHQRLDLRTGQPQRRVRTGQTRRGVEGQPLLGQPALVAQRGQ
jgi:hypothetical protein